MSFKGQLVALRACSEAMAWAGDKPLEEAWETCERADWLLWFAAKVGVDRKVVVLAACAVARTTLQYVKPGEARPLKAIETAEAWVRGEANIEDVRRVAADAADAAYAADAADAAYAAYAAYAAADAADAAYAAVYAAVYAAYARASSLAQSCKIVRATITVDIVKAAIEKL